MKLRVVINLANAAFGEPGTIGWRDETARILRKLADDLEQMQSVPIRLRDINGNDVGEAARVTK